MKYSKICELAAKENKVNLMTLHFILSTIQKHPNGMEIQIPRGELKLMEAYCDKRNIPFYDLDGSGWISVAATYCQLQQFEETR